MNSLRKVSKSIKANIPGIGGSNQKLHPGPDTVDVTKSNADADGNANTSVGNENESAISTIKNSIDLLNSQDSHIFVSVREPWRWVVEEVCVRDTGLSTVTRVETAQDLPSGKLASVAALAASSHTTISRSSRRRNQKNNSVTTDARCILRLEIISNTKTSHDGFRPWILKAFHCTSQAFDGLDDKDELARTLRRCRCEELAISPPSQLINWDVTKEECKNLVGNSLPCLPGENPSPSTSKVIAVLKEPMGSRGTGVFFVRDADEIHSIIEQHRQRAISEDGFLDNLIAEKGRIPSWVLQAEVKPCLLIRDRRKFHIRTYVVCVETNSLLDEPLNGEEEVLMETYIYNRHETRLAKESLVVSDREDSGERDRGAHITETFHRTLLQDEPELVERNLGAKVESFVATAFDALRQDMERRIVVSAETLEEENLNSRGCMVLPHKFAVAGLDLMVTEDERIYLLEVNVNPAAPPPATVPTNFQCHLIDFFRDTMHLVTSRRNSNRCNFHSMEAILRR
mmetsp:Transcript_13177/g.31013  ORF Transcript_13177/g.31013 Transcript_13177/m.31013 type:complete len:514 (+) Transcript_13177:30-1571(+)